MKRISLAVCLALINGCAGQVAWKQPLALQAGGCGNQLTQDQELSLNLAEDVAREGKRHAALAHFQALPEQVPQVRLNKAKVLRQLDRPGARELYKSLLGTCLAASGYQGLGQLAFADGELEQAYKNLHQAVHLAPTDASMRNDYGLVLLALGDRERSRFEFATALELEPTQRRAAVNLASVWLLNNDWEKAAAVSAQASLNPQEMRMAQQQAEHYRDTQRRDRQSQEKATQTELAQAPESTEEQP